MTKSAEWRMSIGALPLPDGVRFRVWAPVARRVDVIVHGPRADRVYPLEGEAAGYFAGTVPGIGPGARYRYRLDGGDVYPDPASRAQPEGVHGPSEVIDPGAFRWTDDGWKGRPLEELVIYELHVGTFTPGGTFDSATERLDHVAGLGATAVQVMPIADFAGARNWGYDGVYLFAPALSYGGVDGFKRLVEAAHDRGLAVILDVVYNHLGPEGNYLPAVTGGRFFTDRRQTPWGDAIDYDGPYSGPVRDFVLQNVLYWFHEYHVDGLRLDATHEMVDESPKHLLAEIVEGARTIPGRPRLLIAEDERNDRRLLLPPEERGFGLDAVWADDLHHQIRRNVAGDSEGYYAQYSGTTADIATTLRQGWWRTGSQPPPPGGEDEPCEGTSPAGFAPPRFVHCIQNHDQVGNRALGERLNHQVPPGVFRALSTLLLTSPYTPMLWMGQEWAASAPFQYFTDHPEELGRLVTEGRREEFGRFSAFRDPDTRQMIPDPQAPETFRRSTLNWEEREDRLHGGMLTLYRALLDIRATHPALASSRREAFGAEALGEGAIAIRRDGSRSSVLGIVNLRGESLFELSEVEFTRPRGREWRLLLATEETRFGGEGDWGRLEADGVLHLTRPGALVLES